MSSHVLSLLAQEGKKADGLILESPFNNLRDELKEHPFSKVRKIIMKTNNRHVDVRANIGLCGHKI